MAFEFEILNFFQELHTPVLTWIMRAASRLGDAGFIFATVSALWFAKEMKFWIPALVLAVLIAFSRMYFYVHYPTDVLGGALLGILCGWMADKLLAWGKKEKNHVQGNVD